MSEKSKGKYRDETTRLRNWDYSLELYFVTIVIKNCEPHFGKIVDGEMHLSQIGKIAKSEWLKTPSLRPDMNIILDKFVVMPDHFHQTIGLQNCRFIIDSRDGMHDVSAV